MGMSILLTGSAGFLGRNIYSQLKKENYNVIGLDKVDSSTTDMKFDFTSPMLGYYLSNKTIDIVIHVGGIADVYDAAQNPINAYKTNIIGTHQLVSLCNSLEIPMIYASTWEVYGEPQYQPIDEKHPTVPDHSYNISKLSGELIVRNALYPISHCVLRLGTLYGIGMRKSAVIPKFIDMAKNGEDISIFGSGEQFRQFTHVEDACRAFITILEEKTEGVYNIVSEEQISINRLAEDIGKYFPDINVIHEDAREADVASSIVSSGKIKNELDWKPNKTFEEGLQEMVEFKQ
jgi:UDP-glucose 4-epimerase